MNEISCSWLEDYIFINKVCFSGFQVLQRVRALFPFTVNPMVKDGKRSGEGTLNYILFLLKFIR